MKYTSFGFPVPGFTSILMGPNPLPFRYRTPNNIFDNPNEISRPRSLKATHVMMSRGILARTYMIKLTQNLTKLDYTDGSYLQKLDSWHYATTYLSCLVSRWWLWNKAFKSRSGITWPFASPTTKVVLQRESGSKIMFGTAILSQNLHVDRRSWWFFSSNPLVNNRQLPTSFLHHPTSSTPNPNLLIKSPWFVSWLPVHNCCRSLCDE